MSISLLLNKTATNIFWPDHRWPINHQSGCY